MAPAELVAFPLQPLALLMALFATREYPWVVISFPQIEWRRLTGLFLAIAFVLYAGATVVRVVARKYYVFLPGYVRWSLTSSPVPQGPVHLLVLFADHFEPNRQLSTTEQWMRQYIAMATR